MKVSFKNELETVSSVPLDKSISEPTSLEKMFEMLERKKPSLDSTRAN